MKIIVSQTTNLRKYGYFRNYMIRKVSIPLVVGMIVAAGVGPSAILSSFALTGASILLALITMRKDTGIVQYTPCSC